MNQKTLTTLIVFGLGLTVLAFSSLFTVYQTEKVLVFQLDEHKRTIEEPGLHWKIPFIQRIMRYDRRLQGDTLLPLEVTAGDQKKIIIDLYGRYLIKDPLLFFRTATRPEIFRDRLTSFAKSAMQEVLGRYPLAHLLSQNRAVIMEQIQEKVRIESAKYGVEVRDVRIVRADLPKANSDAVYRRMRSDRERIAKMLRATGDEEARKIHAEANKERTILLANAERDAEILRGQGDAKAIEIYASAFKKDPAFFEFYRSLEAYKKSLNGQNTTMILTPEGEFFKYLNRSK
ncbi:MAG: protease modulator HflC [bacterium]|nr:protease modulator HflC [bacterium]